MSNLTETMKGFTQEELFLNKLATDSFLNFWSWPNLFRDQGDSSRQGDGKEICDLTVIFGNDVILFSDKRIEFNRTKEVKLAWSRWARGAIRDSVKQIRGARRWISMHPDRIFTDTKCTQRIPMAVPAKEDIQFHNIVVCHGIEDILREHNSESSFSFDSSIKDSSHWDFKSCTPFCIGQIFEGNFVHVFNESTIEIVLCEFDTAADFIEYLKQRELLLSSEKTVLAKSESDIIQLFYENYDDEAGKRLIWSDPNMQAADKILIDKGGIQRLYEKVAYQEKKAADRISYFWDHLIESFSFHVLNDSAIFRTWKTPSDIEPGVRQMAATSRFERRVLSETFFEIYQKTQPEQRGTRLSKDPTNPAIAYLFFILPFAKSFKSNDQYREIRRSMLQDYCRINKYLDPSIQSIIGIACKTREFNEEMDYTFFAEGQDFIFIEFFEWGELEHEAAKEVYEEYVANRLFAKRTVHHGELFEFPSQGADKTLRKLHMSGADRNKPCLCGSGKKMKKCCGA